MFHQDGKLVFRGQKTIDLSIHYPIPPSPQQSVSGSVGRS